MKTKKSIIYLLSFALLLSAIPVNIFAASDIPQIKSETFVLMDADTGQVLFERNMHARIYPASVTKIMTALLALERGNLSGTVTMSHDAVWSVGRDTSHIALDENEQLTLEEALYALAIESANDAANGIAELVGGTMENFAKLMTQRAKELGAKNTNFANAHGLPDLNHYTSAYDLALIMAAAVKIPEFTKIFTTVTYSMPPTNRQPETRKFNRKNSLIEGPYAYEGIIGEKNGWTGDAGYTYIASAKQNGRTLVAAVIKSPDTTARWEDTRALFDYGFIEFVPFGYTADQFAADKYDIGFSGGVKSEVKLIPFGDFNCLISKSADKEEISADYIFFTDEKTGTIEAKAVFSLKSPSDFMYQTLGETRLQIYPVFANPGVKTRTGTEKINPETEEKSPAIKILSSIYGVLSVILQIFGIIAVAFIIWYIIKYKQVQKIKKQKRGPYADKNIYKK
ncbi:MAG: D-alanyl-D-alanine carboxypeptidase [Oscillospiraceae bacterium]|nr:D-alanyl-D-alanine carboxypeptidase [Oscillospiraceae bacterium]